MLAAGRYNYVGLLSWDPALTAVHVVKPLIIMKGNQRISSHQDGLNIAVVELAIGTDSALFHHHLPEQMCLLLEV